MTAPRPREQAAPPSPPDRLPPRRGGRSSPYTYAVSAAGRPAGFARVAGARRGLVHSVRTLAAAVLLAITGGLALPATAQAQESEFLFRTTVHMGFVDTQATYTIISYADGDPNGTHATAYGGIGKSGTFTHDSDEYVIEAVVYSHGTILGPDSLT